MSPAEAGSRFRIGTGPAGSRDCVATSEAWHATLGIVAYGFLVAERSRFSPSARAGQVDLSAPQAPPHFRPRARPVGVERHNPWSIATLHQTMARVLTGNCPVVFFVEPPLL